MRYQVNLNTSSFGKKEKANYTIGIEFTLSGVGVILIRLIVSMTCFLMHRPLSLMQEDTKRNFHLEQLAHLFKAVHF